MSETEDKVVVVVKPRFLEDSETGEWIALFPDLALYAYGDFKAQALKNLKRLLRAHIAFLRERGTLERTLTARGVNWEWEGAYKKTNRPYEDLTEEEEPFTFSPRSAIPPRWVDEEVVEFATAA